MDQYEYIRTASRVYGKGIRQIQRETGHSRVTIRKVLEQEHSDYKKRGHQPCPILGGKTEGRCKDFKFLLISQKYRL